MDNERRGTAYAITEWILREVARLREVGQSDDAESLEMSILALSAVYSIDPTSTSTDENLNKYCPLEDHLTVQRQKGEASASFAFDAEVKSRADVLKNEGNNFMKENNPAEALDRYTQAIQLVNNIPAYYGNRAAAYNKLGIHDKAIEDCRRAVELDRTYSKGYARMGQSLIAQKKFTEARDVLIKAVALDSQYQEDLDDVNFLISTHQQAPASQPEPDSQPNNAGGGINLGSLMSNPAVMEMAQAMASSVMVNPEQLSQFLGGNRPPTATQESAELPDQERSQNGNATQDTGLGGLANMVSGLVSDLNQDGAAEDVMQGAMGAMSQMMGQMSQNGGMDLGSLASMLGGLNMPQAPTSSTTVVEETNDEDPTSQRS
eukprot:m.339333 g.339333  ORF g.339333 m.339333 type:complete len:376 (+) comp18754_c0_seq1:99-1226(+)